MSEKKYSSALAFSFIGAILIIINGLWIAVNGKPIIFSSWAATSVDEVMASGTFWGRIAFGIPGLVDRVWTPFWLIFAVAMLLCTFIIYKKREKQRAYGILIAIFSFLSLPIGGGFYIGTILAFMGGVAGTEWPKPFRETFFGRFIRATLLDWKLYTMLRDNPDIIRAAAFTVILVGFLSGVGNGLYAYNVNLINVALERGKGAGLRILLDGYLFWHGEVVMITVAVVGITIIKWLLLSATIYGIGAKLTGIPYDYDKVARIVAFAFAPEALLVLLPLMFSNEPTLSFNWPIGLYVVTQLCVFLGVVIALIQAFDFPKGKALGVTILGGTIYWLIYQMFIIPTLNVPGVRIEIVMPESSLAILVLVGIATLFAVLLGAFSKK